MSDSHIVQLFGVFLKTLPKEQDNDNHKEIQRFCDKIEINSDFENHLAILKGMSLEMDHYCNGIEEWHEDICAFEVAKLRKPLGKICVQFWKHVHDTETKTNLKEQDIVILFNLVVENWQTKDLNDWICNELGRAPSFQALSTMMNQTSEHFEQVLGAIQLDIDDKEQVIEEQIRTGQKRLREFILDQGLERAHKRLKTG